MLTTMWFILCAAMPSLDIGGSSASPEFSFAASHADDQLLCSVGVASAGPDPQSSSAIVIQHQLLLHDALQHLCSLDSMLVRSVDLWSSIESVVEVVIARKQHTEILIVAESGARKAAAPHTGSVHRVPSSVSSNAGGHRNAGTRRSDSRHSSSSISFGSSSCLDDGNPGGSPVHSTDGKVPEAVSRLDDYSHFWSSLSFLSERYADFLERNTASMYGFLSA